MNVEPRALHIAQSSLGIVSARSVAAHDDSRFDEIWSQITVSRRDRTHRQACTWQEGVMNDKPNAVSELINELDLAFGAPPERGDERKSYIDALVAVARFAWSAVSPDAAWRLMELAYALQDLDAGRVAPVLQRTKRKGGSPPDSGLTWIKRTRVLIAVGAL